MAAPHFSQVQTNSFLATSCDFTCEIVTSFQRLQSFADDWNRLWAADVRAEIFQTFAFARAWWRAYGENVGLRVSVVRRGTEVAGILPLVQRGRNLHFLGAPEFDYNDVICREAETVEVLASALRAHCESLSWDEISLGNLASTSRILRHWPAVSRLLPLTGTILSGARCPTIVFDERREEMFRTLLGNHHFRRHSNKLRKLGHLVFRHIESSNDALLHMQELFRQHIRRRCLSGTPSRFRENGFRTMCEALANELDPGRELRFGVLELDGRPLAYSLGFQANRKYLMYQQSFNIDEWHLAPGDVLLRSLFEYSRGQDVDEFDFSVGMESYKSKFANKVKQNYELHVYPYNLCGLLLQVRQLATSRAVWLGRQITQKVATIVRKIGMSQIIGIWLIAKGRATAPKRYELPPTFLNPNRDESSCGNMQGGDQLHFRSARLSELADLSLENGNILTAERLQSFRDRIRAGEEIWAGFNRGRLVYLAVIQPDKVVATEISSADAQSSLCVFDEIWTAQDYRTTDRHRKLLFGLLDSVTGATGSSQRTSVKKLESAQVH